MTAPSLRAHLAICRTCPQRASQACGVNGQLVFALATTGHCPLGLFGGASPSGEAIPAVTIVITCGPGLVRYVDDAVASADQQRCEVVIVFDGCEVPARYRERPHVIGCDHRHVQHARREGLQVASGRAVLFLDADDTLPEGFVARAYQQLLTATAQDDRVAGIYPAAQYYDADLAQPLSRLDPPEWDRSRFERENFLVCSTLVWTHVLRTSWTDTADHSQLEDWRLWHELVEAGYVFQRGEGLTLHVRVRADSLSRSQCSSSYAKQHGVGTRPLTVFVALSGRRFCWPALSAWLRLVPPQCRLVLCLSTENEEFICEVLATRWPLSDVRIYGRQPLRPGVADADRTHAANSLAVEQTVCGIYNQFAQECTTDYALIVEDDTIPQLHPSDLIAELAEGFCQNTAAVSGVYRSRYNGELIAWTASEGKRLDFLDRVPTERYRVIQGAGFGCLMIRREALRSAPLSVPEGEWFDPRFFHQLSQRGWSVQIASRALCEHHDREKGIIYA